MRIFLAENGQKTGPFHPWEVRGRLERGEITEQLLGWHEGCEKWLPLKELPALGLQERTAEPQPPPLPEIFPPNEPTSDTSNRQKVLYPDGEPPRPWARLFARGVDFLIWFTVCVAFLRVTGQPVVPFLMDPYRFFIACVLIAVPEAICLSIFGATPGKLMLGLSVRTKGGESLPAAVTAWQRALLVFALGNACFSIFAVAAWVFHYISLMKFNSTWWDRKLGLQVRGQPIGPGHIIRLVLFLFALNIIFGLILGPQNLEDLRKFNEQLLEQR